jgi:argininosuccinate synthase
MEGAIAALDPRVEVLAPVRRWNLRTLQDKLNYAHRRGIPIEEPTGRPVTIDRNLWGASIYLHDLTDPWEAPPDDVFVLTRSPRDAPAEPQEVTLGFEQGVPRSLDGTALEPLALVRELNRLGGLHGVGRSDVIEDRLFGIKSRELYETPAPSVLLTAHRDLESLVQSRELLQLKEGLSRRYGELVYTGLWFHDLRESLQGFVTQTQRHVSGEVRVQLYKGGCRVVGRRSAGSLYDGRLASQANLEWFDGKWSELAQGFTSLWTLPSRLAARRQPAESPEPGGWAAP